MVSKYNRHDTVVSEPNGQPTRRAFTLNISGKVGLLNIPHTHHITLYLSRQKPSLSIQHLNGSRDYSSSALYARPWHRKRNSDFYSAAAGQEWETQEFDFRAMQRISLILNIDY